MKRLFLAETAIAIAAVITAATAFTAVSYATERKPNVHLNYYPETAIVHEIDEEADEVVVRNSIGILYSFYGCEEWECGDMVSMIMDDMDTPSNIYDDAIIVHHYVGHASDFE